MLCWKGNKVTIVSGATIAFFCFLILLYYASTESSESQLASTRPGGVACLRDENLDVVPGMPNGVPFKTTNGATVSAPSDGAGDGVEEAGSTAASSA